MSRLNVVHTLQSQDARWHHVDIKIEPELRGKKVKGGSPLLTGTQQRIQYFVLPTHFTVAQYDRRQGIVARAKEHNNPCKRPQQLANASNCTDSTAFYNL